MRFGNWSGQRKMMTTPTQTPNFYRTHALSLKGFVLAVLICGGIWIGMATVVEADGAFRNLFAAFTLNLGNGFSYLAIAFISNAYKDGSGMGMAVAVLGVQLFVNTFTIFFLIGLHTVNVGVFISAFCAMYVVHLTCGVLVLHLDSLKESRNNS